VVLLWRSTAALDPYSPLEADKPPLRVQVVGLDWKWLFIYPDEHIATVGVLAFSADRPLALELTSDSVNPIKSSIRRCRFGRHFRHPPRQSNESMVIQLLANWSPQGSPDCPGDCRKRYRTSCLRTWKAQWSIEFDDLDGQKCS
jgi:hypothetical protein